MRVAQWDTFNVDWKQRATKIKQTPTDHENKCEHCTIHGVVLGFSDWNFDEL